MSNEIITTDNQNMFIAPVASVEDALATYQAMKEFVKGVLKENVDFGTIPGTGKPTLYKPGSEKLLRFFGVSTSLEILEAVEDWSGSDHGGEPFFFYRYKAIALRNGTTIAEAVGSCSSWEKKYRYRTAEIKCPACGAANIRHSKNGSGWYCWAKTGGCGATFDEGEAAIVDQPRGMIPNPDPADLVNTIDKMAQKRAIVAVSLLACNASEYFTQDIEDYIDGTFSPLPEGELKKSETKKTDKPKPAPKSETSYTREDAAEKGEPMTLEKAYKITNSEGELYASLDDEKLTNMTYGIGKALRKSDITDDRKTELDMKLDAIRVILKARSTGEV